MSTIRKLDKQHRERAYDRKARWLRTAKARARANPTGPEAELLLAVATAVDLVRRDPTMHGGQKQWMYGRILDEYMLNVQRLKAPATAPLEPT